MAKELIFIGSVNKALKAREILKQNGIYAQIERSMGTPDTGCGYSVLIVNGSYDAALIILDKYGLISPDKS